MDIPDLNLLRVFEALLEERSVSRASAKLGIGQPATSHALKRLRDHLEDELFVRTPRGMEPTARAEDLAGPILAALAGIRAAMAGGAGFDPATAERSFSICGGDYAGMLVLPGLVRRLRREAPGIDLRFRFVEKDAALGLVEGGEIDLAFGVFPDLPQHLASEVLLREEFACLTDGRHLGEGALDLAAYLRSPHLLFTERGDATGTVDRALRARGLSRRIAMTAPHILLVPMLVEGTDLVVTTGTHAARAFARSGRLRLHPPPIDLPAWSLVHVWQRRRTGDAGLAWLRTMVRACVAEASPAEQHPPRIRPVRRGPARGSRGR